MARIKKGLKEVIFITKANKPNNTFRSEPARKSSVNVIARLSLERESNAVEKTIGARYSPVYL